MASTTSTTTMTEPTEMIYMTYEGCWQMECTSTVLQVNQTRLNDDADEVDSTTPKAQQQDAAATVDIILDRTVLHAQGGGQPTDTGRIVIVSDKNDDDDGDSKDMAHLTVLKVTLDRSTGLALHTCAFVPIMTTTIMPNVGDTVRVLVDQNERRLLSECHTAGHVVDAAMAQCDKVWKPTKGYHFLDGPYVEYEGTVAVTERDALLSRLQASFCQLVQEDISTAIDIVDLERADQMCNRFAPDLFDVRAFADPLTQHVRVVTVAHFSCPCGGTHVKSTVDLAARGWNIIGIKSKKGVVRIKYGPSKNGNGKK
jgi:Ser-tRNA(Ala) deacylase AlaX